MVHPSTARRHELEGRAAPHVRASLAAQLEEFAMKNGSSKRNKAQDADTSDDSDAVVSVQTQRMKKRVRQINEHEQNKNASVPAAAPSHDGPSNADYGQQLDGNDDGSGSYDAPSLPYDELFMFEPEQPQMDSSVPELNTGGISTDNDSDEDPWADEAGFDTDSDCDVEGSYGALQPEDPFLATFEHVSEGFIRETQLDASDISNNDRQLLRLYAFKLRHHITDSAYKDLGSVFPHQDIPSLTSARTRIALLAGFKPVLYDCCPNSCVCYTGPHSNLDSCPYCSTSRYQSNGRARKHFTYLPLIPRLRAAVGSKGVAAQMRYRAFEHAPEEDVIKDVFDSKRYKRLCRQRVVVDGHELPHKFFDDPRDIALGLSTDGFAPFRKRKSTCWPLILFNYNLPPEVRFHLRNILSLGVIPGPRKPADIDSFLWPFVQEALELEVGVPAFDVLEQKMFALRAYLLLVFGDIPAMSLITQMKGHNGHSPCRICKIIGLRTLGARATTHYVPLDRSRHPAVVNDTSKVKVYDAGNLPLRTHNEMIAQAKEVQFARTQSDSIALAKKYGIKGLPIWVYLSSMSLSKSFPYDFMHLIWENLMKNLVRLWTGEFKGLNEGSGSYQLQKSVWEAIGAATAECGSTIPGCYGARPPNVTKDNTSTTADTWSFWTLYIAPFLITKDEIEQLRRGFQCWVKQFEKLYYQNDPQHVSTCPVTIHALLHIADLIEACGPVWTYWAFPMERYCGIIRPAIKSKKHPFASLDRYVVECAQITQIQLIYNLNDKPLSLLGSLQERQSQLRGMRAPLYPMCTLLPPSRKSDPLDTLTMGRIEKSLATRYNKAKDIRSVKQCLLSARIEQWAKVRIDDGDTILAVKSIGHGDNTQHDATYVRMSHFSAS
ncbi:hypothetical protein EWM64_g2680 [Hericium alpestre]|uniref:Transposase family Tnp2 protein n=1 Tax=Hericium alpestre TaxID=135208 RepID=A0A4Z0A4J7_9AGAM|nr:hypothetical protein EWM64_g2680 [Hericium alpestre]